MVRRLTRALVKAETRFVQLPAGIHPLVPYRLKRGGKRGRRGRVGQPITYPALVLNLATV